MFANFDWKVLGPMWGRKRVDMRARDTSGLVSAYMAGGRASELASPKSARARSVVIRGQACACDLLGPRNLINLCFVYAHEVHCCCCCRCARVSTSFICISFRLVANLRASNGLASKQTLHARKSLTHPRLESNLGRDLRTQEREGRPSGGLKCA